MTHQAIALTVAMSASVIGAAAAIGASLLSARRARRTGTASLTPPQAATALFITAALFAAMGGALIYQGIDGRFPPDFIGAAVFLAGTAIVLRMGLRRRRA